VRPVARPAVRLPLEHYRLLAGALVVILLGITVLAPLGAAPLPASALQAPALAGTTDAFAQIFDYRAPSQRVTPGTPARTVLLRAATDTPQFHDALVGEILRSDSAEAAPQPARNNLLVENPGRWNDMETFYQGTSGGVSGDLGYNGVGLVTALRSTRATGAERTRLIEQALNIFAFVVSAKPNVWYYQYNLALTQMMLGRYGAAVTVLDELNKQDNSHPEVGFMRGLAALRTGEPNQAIQSWTGTANANVADWSRLASEGLSAALAARGDAAAAATAYHRALETSSGVDWTLYEQLLRLEVQRGTPEAMLPVIDSLRGRVRSDDKADLPRLLYDRGRILALLGRPGPAQSAFEAASALLPDDPAFHLAAAQVLIAGGNARRGLTEAEAALRGAGIDPNTADFGPAISALTGNADAQRLGQAVLGARLAQAAARGALGMTAQLRGMRDGLVTLASSDPAHAGWYKFYAGLVTTAGGSPDAWARLLITGLESAGTPPAAPSKGMILAAAAPLLDKIEGGIDLDDILQRLGGSLATPALATDAPTAAFYGQLAAALEAAGRVNEAGPLYRAAAAWEQSARAATENAPVSANGVPAPVQYRLAEANYLLRRGEVALAQARYRQVLAVEPDTTDAWTNIGIAYDRQGRGDLARNAFEHAAALAPENALAAHNAGVVRYSALDRPGGEAAFAAGGSAAWSAGGLGLLTASGTGTQPSLAPAGDFLVRVPALVALLLLLLHTLILRPANETDAAPSRTPYPGVLGRLGARLPDLGSRLATPLSLGIAIVVAGAAWAWAAAANNPLVWVVLLVTGLLAALIAIGGQEGAQALAARLERQRGTTTHRLSPLGLLLAVLTAPFGLVYGWQIITRAGAAGGTPSDLDDTPVPALAARPSRGGAAPAAAAVPAFGGRPMLMGWGAMGPQTRVALAGLLANVVLALLAFGLYKLAGWPTLRLILLANVAVLAFTAVSEPPAEGWYVWRRAPLLWLALFIGAAAALTLLALGVV
jgi:tetratricopeptide (TPR) repeat protein